MLGLRLQTEYRAGAKMDPRCRRMAELTDELELEMRALGQWGDVRPSSTALASNMPFCYDTLPFNEWLQWVFVSRVRRLLEQQKQLPTGSDIFPLAEVWFDEQGMEVTATAVLQIIRRIDECLNEAMPSGLH